LLKAQTNRGKLRFTPGELTSAFEERLQHLIVSCQERGSLVTLITPASRLRRSQSRLARTRSAAGAVFFMPYMSIEGMLDGGDAYDEAIRRTGKTMGTLIVDAEKAVPGDSSHFKDSGHFRAAGSRRMAACVAEALSQHSAFRALATKPPNPSARSVNTRNLESISSIPAI
jgi:hypothetical protein